MTGGSSQSPAVRSPTQARARVCGARARSFRLRESVTHCSVTASSRATSHGGRPSSACTYSATPVSQGVWHSLEIRARVRGAKKDEVKTWLDGHRVEGLTRSEALGKTPIGSIQLGENIPGRTFAVAFDDVLVGAWRP